MADNKKKKKTVKKNRSNIKNTSAKQRLSVKQYLLNGGHLALCMFTALYAVFVFGPIFLARQTGEYAFSLGMVMTAVVICAAVGILGGFFALLLKEKYIYVESFATGSMLTLFVIMMLFPASAGLLDGRIDLNSRAVLIPALIRGAIILVLCLTIAFFQRKHLRLLSLPLLAACIVFTCVSYEAPSKMVGNAEDVYNSIQTFSSGKNIVVIGVDSLQGTVAEKAFQENPEYLNAFDGFTVFSRTIGTFQATRLSRPIIQSGRIWSSEYENVEEYERFSMENSFVSDLKTNDVRVDVLRLNTYGLFPSLNSVTEGGNIKMQLDYGTAITASIARITGYWIDNPFSHIHSTRSIYGVDNADDYRYKLDSAWFYENLLMDLRVGDETSKCLYFWDQTLHPPIAFERGGSLMSNPTRSYSTSQAIDEAVFEYSQLGRMFERMKAIGVYDNSLIILVSDHGLLEGHQEHYDDTPDFPEGYKRYGNYKGMGLYNTVLFVKPPYARGSAEITHDPAWYGDVRPLVNYYFNNFQNQPARAAVAALRAENPLIEVVHIPAEGVADGRDYKELDLHNHFFVEHLHEIGSAISALTGIYDK